MNINLIPWRENSRKKSRTLFLMECIAALAMMVIILVMTQPYLTNLKQQKMAQITNLQQKISSLAPEYKIYAAIEKNYQKNSRIKNFSENIHKHNIFFINLLEILPGKLPETIYLTQLIKTGNHLRLEGESTTHADVTALLQQLEKIPQLESPKLSEIVNNPKKIPKLLFVVSYDLNSPYSKEITSNEIRKF